MALDADLVVDRLADIGIQKLNGDFAMLNGFAIRPIEETESIGRNTVQVEASGTLPTAYDNSSDYQAGSGTNTNVAVTITEISAQQTITSQEQLQGHRFLTAVSGMSESIKDAAWDDAAALFTTANYGNASSSPTAQASFTTAIAQRMFMDLTGGPGEINLLIARGVAAAVMLPDSKDYWELAENGAYGYNRIHLVKDFTGGQANLYAVALNAQKAMVVVNGPPRRAPGVDQAMISSEIFTLENGIRVEFQVWVDLQTKALWMGFATCIGFAVVDAAAARLILSA